MAHGESLRLREIQPRTRLTAEPGPRSGTWRKDTKALAKRLGISRRRAIRRIAKAKRGS